MFTADAGHGLTRQAARAARRALLARPEGAAVMLGGMLAGSLIVCALFAASSREGLRRRLGWVRPDLTLAQFGLALLATYGLAAFELGLLALLHGLHLLPVPDQGLLLEMMKGMAHAPLWVGVLLAVMGGVCPGVGEESMFRGFVQRGLARHALPWVAIAVAAAAFGLWHGSLVRAPGAALLGVLAGWVAWRSDSTLPAMALHALNNTTLFLLALGGPDEFAPRAEMTAKDGWIAGAVALAGVLVLVAALRPLRAAFRARDAGRAAAAAEPDAAPA